ncbi:unnamed protein product [Urochloa humidicola]
MGQGARVVADLREEEKKEHGGEGSLAREAAWSEQDDVSGAGNAGVHGAAGSESDEEEDAEEALTEESNGGVAPLGNAGRGDALASAQNEDHDTPPPEANPAATTAHFELRGFRPARRAIAHATPPSSYRLPLRGRKRSNPSRLPIVDAGDAASGCGNNAYHPATSEAASGPAASPGSPSATSRPAGFPATGHGGNNEPLALGSTAATRSGEASDPERDVFPVIHLVGTGPPEMDPAAGMSTHGGRKGGVADATHAAAAASCRPPSRSRKRRRPEHYPDTEEAEVAAARARARRSDAALDRVIACVACASAPEQQRPAASGGGPEVTDESARVLSLAAILGTALALSVVSCVLFYIVGQQTASGPSDSHKKKVSEASRFFLMILCWTVAECWALT